MDSKNQNTDSQGSADPSALQKKKTISLKMRSSTTPDKGSPKPAIIANTKLSEKVTKLRAFSIQKKSPITTITVPKLATSGNTTVLIGKLSSNKITPKPGPSADDDQKKLPKPPKPGAARKALQDSYSDLQKKTLAEIEDMKRKMELVELGIPLGLICPTATSEKAMPTKAMPPIKSFLEPAQLDEIILEAKKARAEGRQFKFDYQKLLPDYDNPFQRKKEEPASEKEKPDNAESCHPKEKDRMRSETHVHENQKPGRKDERDRYRSKEKYKDRHEKNKDRDDRFREERYDRTSRREIRKEADLNLHEYVVCDSWSLDEKNSNSSPQVDDKAVKDQSAKHLYSDRKSDKYSYAEDQFRMSNKQENKAKSSPMVSKKIGKLKPVMDSFKFEIDPTDDAALDIYESPKLDNIPKPKSTKKHRLEFEDDGSKETSNDINDDFLESVINEINQGDLDDDGSHDKGLVEYDLSPCKDDENSQTRESVTPELDDKMREQSSRRSNYSDSYRSVESVYKTSESGYKSVDSCRSTDTYRMSMDKEDYECKMSNETAASLDMWSFVLKICQPLLFRHDRNKCFKETTVNPKIWHSVNPKACSCVKDRSVVYNELEMCKMNFVYQLYEKYQVSETSFPNKRTWYPRLPVCLSEGTELPAAPCEWEAEDTQRAQPQTNKWTTTPKTKDELSLDKEYQRFMDAVWPEVSSDNIAETSRSTTPVKQESRKKKLEETEKKKAKKIKLSSEGWSQESDVEDDDEKSIKKTNLDKVVKEKRTRKRKRSSSTLSTLSDNEIEVKKKKKAMKKANKKSKVKLGKSKKLDKKKLKKLKEKKKNKKHVKLEVSDESDGDDHVAKKKESRKSKKKKQQKLKKKSQKKKAKEKSSTSDSSSSTSDTDTTDSSKHRKRKERKRKRKRKESTDSTEELFDVNILNNIKTEKLTDDENGQKLKDQEFSPRRQQTRKAEIINVKELQEDFVGKSVQIKKEIEDEAFKTRENRTEEIASEYDDVSNTELETDEESQKEKETDTNRLTPQPQAEQQNQDEIKIQNETVTPEIQIPIEVKPQNKIQISVDTTNPNITPSDVNTSSEIKLSNDTTPSDINVSQKIDMFNELTPSEVKTSLDIQLPDEIKQVREIKLPNETTSSSETVETYIRPVEPVPRIHQEYSFSESHIELYNKEIESNVEEEKFADYEAENYEMYEQLAMAYQNDVANKGVVQSPVSQGESRIETVVRRRRGEITCDWRAGDAPPAQHPAPQPSRWGLKPGEVNIVLTGGSSEQYQQNVNDRVYQIESLANRTENNTGYDEAYLDMYGASDRLQYGDCFSDNPHDTPHDGKRETTLVKPARSSLDMRIDEALKNTVLGKVAKEPEPEKDKDEREKRNVGGNTAAPQAKSGKRVSFADGYTPGQDSDVEEPPVRKRRRVRRVGCAWPCPATHRDHVPLWDALPPPPPPPGDPPPHPLLLRAAHAARARAADLKANVPMSIMPPDPPPGLISFA